MPPEISIIVPSYNQSPIFVTECLQSICAQEGASFEIIFVDGGSHPDTLAAAESFRDRCAHFISEPDEGQADAINKGLRLACGSLVTWLNTDDFYLPDAFRHMVSAFKNDPNSPFYMGLGYRTDITGRERNRFYPEEFAFNREAFSLGLNFILQPSTFIRREALEIVGGQVNKTLEYVLDTELWFRLLTLGNPCRVPFPIACSREHPATKTSTGGWNRFNEIQVLAARFTGYELTPGVLAELSRLLHELLADPKMGPLFPDRSEKKIMELWGCAGEGLRMLSGRDDGFPIKGYRPPEAQYGPVF